MKHAVLSCSGGMDSTSLLLNLMANNYLVHIINFNYGSRQNKFENDCLLKNIKYITSKHFNIDYKLIDISDALKNVKSSLTRDDISTPQDQEYNTENRKVTVVPNRNAIFSSIIFAQALSLFLDTNEDVDIALGIHAGDDETYPDCRLHFFENLMKVFKEGNYDSEHVNHYIPFVSLSKSQVLADGLNSCKILSLNPNIIYKNTISCYVPNERGLSCGRCATCLERLKAFEDNGLCDPTLYTFRNN